MPGDFSRVRAALPTTHSTGPVTEDGCRRTERRAIRIRQEPCGVYSTGAREAQQAADVAPVCLLESSDVLLPQG